MEKDFMNVAGLCSHRLCLALALAAGSFAGGPAFGHPHESYVTNCPAPEPSDGIGCADAVKLRHVCRPAPGTDVDCVHVLEIGDPRARNILILIPGGSEGAAVFRNTARHVVATVPR